MFRKAKRLLARVLNPVTLVVHIGLHKTGSTYFQHVLNDNSQRLSRRGVYYQHQNGYPAHHWLAWDLLRGDHQPLVQLLDGARQAKCKRVIISSEDLEGILFDDRPLQAIKRAARIGLASRVEFHVVLRDPGAAFASLFRELAKHTYADAVALFHSVMERGFIHMVEPGGGVPYWYYSFDYSRDLAKLEERSACTVRAYDFTDADPFPGWRIVGDLVPALESMPGEGARNAKSSDFETARLFEEHLTRVGVHREIDLSSLDQLSDAVSERYRGSYEKAVRSFAPAKSREP